jgi:Ribosomal protein L11, RNA binding domain
VAALAALLVLLFLPAGGREHAPGGGHRPHASPQHVAATVRIQADADQASPGKVGRPGGQAGARSATRDRQNQAADLNTDDLDSAERIVAGSARSMGIEVVTQGDDQALKTPLPVPPSGDSPP